MSGNIQVKVQLRDGTTASAMVEVHPNPASNTVELTLSGLVLALEQHRFEADDLFEAMTDLRRALDRIDAKLLCAGARRDVFPSGMSRDMSGGRKAYATQMGRPGRLEDLVDIFDDAAPEHVGTVQKQRDFHKRWIKSLQ